MRSSGPVRGRLERGQASILPYARSRPAVQSGEMPDVGLVGRIKNIVSWLLPGWFVPTEPSRSISAPTTVLPADSEESLEFNVTLNSEPEKPEIDHELLYREIVNGRLTQREMYEKLAQYFAVRAELGLALETDEYAQLSFVVQRLGGRRGGRGRRSVAATPLRRSPRRAAALKEAELTAATVAKAEAEPATSRAKIDIVSNKAEVDVNISQTPAQNIFIKSETGVPEMPSQIDVAVATAREERSVPSVIQQTSKRRARVFSARFDDDYEDLRPVEKQPTPFTVDEASIQNDTLLISKKVSDNRKRLVEEARRRVAEQIRQAQRQNVQVDDVSASKKVQEEDKVEKKEEKHVRFNLDNQPKPSFSFTIPVTEPKASSPTSASAEGLVEKPKLIFDFSSSTNESKLDIAKESSPWSSVDSKEKANEPTEASKPIFSFGTSISSKPAFSFEAPKEANEKDGSATQSETSKLPISIVSEPLKESTLFEPPKVAAPSSAFSFGQVNKSDKPAFSFGPSDAKSSALNKTEDSLKTEEAKRTLDVTSRPSNGESKSFSFGTSTSTQQPVTWSFGATSDQSKPFSFGTMAGEQKAESPFGAKPEKDTATLGDPSAASKVQTPFSFGSSHEQAKPTAAFGSEVSKTTSPFGNETSKATFSLGSTEPPKSSFNFGTSTEAGPAFSFGASAGTKSTFETTVETKPAFGSTAETKPAFGSTAETKPAFGSTAETKSAFGSTAETKPAFGSTAETRPTFSFGATTESKPTFSFGSATETRPAFGSTSDAKSTLSFGSATESKPAPSFGTTLETKPTFSFGATTETKPSFSFGPAAEAKPAFSFGTTSNDKTAKRTTFSSAEMNTENNKRGATFGTNATMGERRGFSYGSDMSDSKPVGSDVNMSSNTFGSLSFGGAAPFGSTNSGATPSFGFNANQGPTPNIQPFGVGPSTPFNFNANQTMTGSASTSQPPAFSFNFGSTPTTNQPLNFNFGSAVPPTNAPSSSSSAPFTFGQQPQPSSQFSLGTSAPSMGPRKFSVPTRRRK